MAMRDRCLVVNFRSDYGRQTACTAILRKRLPYLRHLVMADEILACTLLTLHNLHFYLDLMAQARTHIEAGDYGPWHRAWIGRYEAGENG